MTSKPNERTVEQRVNMRGGNGTVQLEALFPAGLPAHCRMASVIKLEKGCSIGAHRHDGEGEIFYVLSGVARYYDNGVPRLLEPGDAAVVYQGQHAVEGVSDETCRLMAVIITD